MSLFSAAFREARQAAGVSQDAVASALSVSQSFVCDWERGHRLPPGLERLEVFARFVGADVGRLFALAILERGRATVEVRTEADAIEVAQYIRTRHAVRGFDLPASSPKSERAEDDGGW